MFDRKIMAQRLQAVRLRKSAELGTRLTQADVAAAADVSRSHVANAEGGKTGISVEAAFKLAEFYGVSLDYLTGLSLSEVDSTRDLAGDTDERSLLCMWRAMNAGQRVAMFTIAEELAEKTSSSKAG
ncbi:helix-turn-helix domain-containing protein [Asaia astilbis]|uniref:helix-turn-helix domain-containing protein n=1 Tax=Asaia astilbis TaxID=610244 RepID=UPI000470C527|nr:helix-turn-helix transcriptional regulator [Asaia astilbis]